MSAVISIANPFWTGKGKGKEIWEYGISFPRQGYTEIIKLKIMLASAGIGSTIFHTFDGYRVRVGALPTLDAAEHVLSYGGSMDTIEIYYPKKKPLWNDDVLGGFTADLAFELIKSEISENAEAGAKP